MILTVRNEPKHLRTRYQVTNYTQIGKNLKVRKNQKDDLGVKFYPKRKSNKKQNFVEKPKLEIECPICRNGNSIEFDRRH